MTGLLQSANDFVCAVLGASEHQDAIGLFGLEDLDQQRRFRGLVGKDDALFDAFNRRGLRRDCDAGRITQHRIGEAGDFLRHGGREEQRLPHFGKHGDDLLDVVNKAHVEHAIGFVQNEDFDLVEAQRALIDKIEQAARCCHKDLCATRETAHLPVDRHAADGQFDREWPNMPPINAEAVRDLAGQFACRRKHQHAAGFLRGTLTLVEQVIEDRQREGRGLAGSGLRNTNGIAALKGYRNGLILDRSGSDVLLFREGAKDRRCEAEIVK